MKITDVRAIHLRVEDPSIGLFDGSYDDCLIVVETDAPGITGIGEVESLAPAIRAIVESKPAHNHAQGLRHVLLGADPLDESLWQRMYDANDYIGRRGLVMHAIGGVDLALWDIRGKVAKKPIAELLGGVRHARIPAYGTIYPMARTTGEVAEQVARAKGMNLRNIKFAADPWWLDDVKLTDELLRAARRALGDSGKIIIDAALAYPTSADGLKLYPTYRAIGIDLLEAPLPLDDVAGHAEMARHGIPLGVGDLGLTHVDEFIQFMEHGGASICQPDISMVGGFTGIRRIDEAAMARGKRVITHGYKTNIEIAANLQFLASRAPLEMLEYSTSRSPLRWELTRESIPVEEDGCVAVPSRPGLGVEVNWDVVSRYRVAH